MSNLVKIGDFCETNSGGTPSRDKSELYYGGSIPWVKSGELRENYITDTEEKITHIALNESSAKLNSANSILLAMYGATVGRMAILGVDAATNQAICAIKPNPEKADLRYVFHALQAKVPDFIHRAKGGAQPNISQRMIRETEINLPSLEEQKRIAAILDKADSLRRKRAQAIALADDFLRATFLDMFGDPVTNPKGWAENCKLSDVAEIVSGITKGRVTKGEELFDVPYLAVSNVQDRFIKLDVVKRIEATKDEIERYKLLKDDLLLTEGGDPDKLGRGALWDGSIENCIHQNHVFRVRVNSELILPVFLNWLVGSQRGKSYFLSAAKQTTGIASINMRQLKAFPLILPPVSLQAAFSEMVEKTAQLLVKMKRQSLAELQSALSLV